MMYQAGITRFDRKTKQATAYPVPKEWQNPTTQESMVSPQHSDVDGKVWTNNQDTHVHYRVDVATGKYEDLGDAKDTNGTHINAYGMPTDLQNNVYLLNFGGTTIGRATPRPTRSRSGRRRCRRRGRGADGSTPTTCCGSPNTAPTASAGSIQHRRDQGMATADAVGCALRRGQGQERRNLDRLDADRPRRPARSRRPTPSPNICCRARPISAACSSMTAASGRCSGSAATTAPRSSRSSRWIDRSEETSRFSGLTAARAPARLEQTPAEMPSGRSRALRGSLRLPTSG